jgi:hypothetical protein
LSSRVRFLLSSGAAVLLLAWPVGCGDDDDGNDRENPPEPVSGTFVGKLQGSEPFVAVVAAPPAKGQDQRDVSALVCDGREVCSWYSGSAKGNAFVAKSADGEGQTRVRLNGKEATGSVDLPEDETGRYKASEATATAGLYDLTVSPEGKVQGASAAGVGLTGRLTLPPPGDGRIKLADGTRIRLEVTKGSDADSAGLKAGQLRMVVTTDGQARGVGIARGDGGGAAFYVRSTGK